MTPGHSRGAVHLPTSPERKRTGRTDTCRCRRRGRRPRVPRLCPAPPVSPECPRFLNVFSSTNSKDARFWFSTHTLMTWKRKQMRLGANGTPPTPRLPQRSEVRVFTLTLTVLTTATSVILITSRVRPCVPLRGENIRLRASLLNLWGKKRKRTGKVDNN